MPLPSAPRNCPAGAGAKSPPASAGDTGDPGSTPGSERCPGVENGNPLQCSCPECRGQRSLAGYGQQRAGHDWAHTHTHTHTQEPWTPECGSISGSTVTRAGWRWHPWRWARSHGTETQCCQLTEGGRPALVRRCLLWFARLFLLPKKEWVFQGQSPRTLGEREKKKNNSFVSKELHTNWIQTTDAPGRRLSPGGEITPWMGTEISLLPSMFFDWPNN